MIIEKRIKWIKTKNKIKDDEIRGWIEVWSLEIRMNSKKKIFKTQKETNEKMFKFLTSVV